VGGSGVLLTACVGRFAPLDVVVVGAVFDHLALIAEAEGCHARVGVFVACSVQLGLSPLVSSTAQQLVLRRSCVTVGRCFAPYALPRA
jgi:hypothetical protein